MPNRDVHAPAGLIAGGLAAVLLACDPRTPSTIAESLGGLLGGMAGAAAPDLIDPPTSPNHRSIGHSLVVAGGGLAVSAIRLDGWRAAMHGRANAAALRGDVGAAAFWRALGGFLVGFWAGYVSHLFLDSRTPKGLPLMA